MTDHGDRTITISLGGGLLLILTGIIAYVVTDFASVTALIPAVFGVMIAVLGIMGRQPSNRRRSILGIGLLALLLILGSLMGARDVLDMIQGTDVETPIATVSQVVSILIGLVIVATTVSYARRDTS